MLFNSIPKNHQRSKPAFNKRVDLAIKNMHDVSRLIAAFFGLIQDIFVAFAALIAPWAIPIAPAGIAANAIYNVVLNAGLPYPWSLVIAVAYALGLETVGAGATHATLQHYSAWRKGYGDSFLVKSGFSLVISYVMVGVFVTWGVEDPRFTIEVAGSSAFVLVFISYLAQSLSVEARRIESQHKAEFEIESLEIQTGQQIKFEQARVKARTEQALALNKQRFALQQKRLKTQQGLVPSQQSNGSQPTASQQSNGSQPTANTLPSWLAVVPADKAHFLALVTSRQIALPEDASNSEIARQLVLAGVKASQRTARQWVSDAKGVGNAK